MNVTGSSALTLDDVETAAGIVQEAANPDANIIFGATSCDEFVDEIRVTVIATGFETKEAEEEVKTPAKKTSFSDDDADIFTLFNR